jgi:ribose transport system permease protein
LLRDYAVPATLVALFVGLSLTTENFLTEQNLKNVLEQSTVIGLIAVAGTLVIIAGGFDLSVGSIFAISGVIAAQAAIHWDPVAGLIVGILAGAACGVGNGILVTVFRINPFIATLGSAIVIAGIALRITHGDLITVDLESSFTELGLGSLFGLKYSIWIWLAFTLVMGFLLARTTLGRYIYASGGNEEAARLSGVRVALVRTTTYVLSGFAAGLAGVISASQIGTGQADVGAELPLTAVAAIVVGGTSIWGGQGAIWRTIVGVLLLSLISNGFNLKGLDPVYYDIVYGGIILVAAGLDAFLRRRGV